MEAAEKIRSRHEHNRQNHRGTGWKPAACGARRAEDPNSEGRVGWNKHFSCFRNDTASMLSVPSINHFEVVLRVRPQKGGSRVVASLPLPRSFQGPDWPLAPRGP